MKLGPRTLYDLTIALIVLQVANGMIVWRDVAGPTYGFWASLGVSMAMAVLMFMVTGIYRPPGSTPTK